MNGFYFNELIDSLYEGNQHEAIPKEKKKKYMTKE